MSPNTQNQTGKDLKISKNKFNGYGGQMGSRTSGKNISTVWIVGQFDMGELECRTSFVQHFRSLKFSDKYDARPAIWAHVNGYIEAVNVQKSLETIFIQEFLNAENQND